MAENINYMNGAWKIGSDSMVPIYDGGFLLGDGLFETIRFDNRKLFYPDKHLKRLFDGLDIIRIKLKRTSADLTLLLLKYLLHNADLVIDTTVNINAIPILSKILGCRSNKGNINICIRIANIKPLPTSIMLSNISFIFFSSLLCVDSLGILNTTHKNYHC